MTDMRRVARALVLLVLAAACTQGTPETSADPSATASDMVIINGTPVPRSDVGGLATPSVESPPESPQPAKPSKAIEGVSWEAPGGFLASGGGLVFVGGDKHVAAYRLACRRNCEPVMKTSLQSYYPILIHGQNAYVATDHGVAILRLGCRGSCGPVAWLFSPDAGRPGTNSYLSQPPNSYIPEAVHNGDVVVQIGWDGAASSGVFDSQLAGFALGCEDACKPVWMTNMGHGRNPPTFDGDQMFAPRMGGWVDAYTCDASTATCGADWTARLLGRPPATWTQSPAISDGTMVASTDGCACGAESGPPVVATFPTSCASTCLPRGENVLDGYRFIAGPLVYGGIAYVVTLGEGAQQPPVGIGMPLDCTGSCDAVVDLELGHGETWRDPVAADGSVLVGKGYPGGVLAFDAGCRGHCAPIATAETDGSVSTVVPVSDGFVVAAGPNLYLFPQPPSSEKWRPSWTWNGTGRMEQLVMKHDIAIVELPTRTIAVRLPKH